MNQGVKETQEFNEEKIRQKETKLCYPEERNRWRQFNIFRNESHTSKSVGKRRHWLNRDVEEELDKN